MLQKSDLPKNNILIVGMNLENDALKLTEHN